MSWYDKYERFTNSVPAILTYTYPLMTFYGVRQLTVAYPEAILGLRILCGVGFGILFLVILFMKRSIDALQDARTILVSTNEMTVSMLPSVLPPDPATDLKIRVSVQEYDTVKWKSFIRQFVFTVTLGVALHLYLESAIPIVAQLISQPRMILASNLFKVHIVGWTDKEHYKLRRPWEVNQQKGMMEKYLESYQRELAGIQDPTAGTTTTTQGAKIPRSQRRKNNKKA